MPTKCNNPLPADLEAGQTYCWCSCGLTQTMPLCDGSHKKQQEKRPVKFIAEESKRHYLCACTQTGNPPYCDSSHCKES